MTRRRELLAASVCLVTACSGPGNTGKENSSPSAELVAAVPWANGGIAQRNLAGEPVMPSEPVYPPVGTDTADPGSRPVDCTGLSEIDLYWQQTFEPKLEDTNPDDRERDPIGIAEHWSSNDDETKGSFRVPGDASWYPGLVRKPGVTNRYEERFGLAAQRISGAPSCDGLPNEWAFHFRGGRFNYYGAAAEHPLQAYEILTRPLGEEPPPEPTELCPTGTDVCPANAEPGESITPAGLPLRHPDGTRFRQQRHLYWDVSLYDGVAFWARRGPDGQPGMLFALQDKHTSDALNRIHQTFCRRIKACRPVCQNGGPCSPVNPDAPNPTYRCFDPATGAAPSSSSEPALIEEVFPLCGPSACSGLGHYPDPDFDGLECKPYEFTGSQAGHYCYGDVPPPPDEERCGDAWVAPVRLSTDWKLYVIPFTEFRQVGFAKRAPFLDLHSIYSIALQFPVGFADVYVDNVSFYRRRR